MKTIPPGLTHAADLFTEACHLCLQHQEVLRQALAYYGDHGQQLIV